MPGAGTSASLHGRGDTVVVFGHGAGGNRRNPMLVALADALAGSGRAAVLYDFPYAEKGLHRPDPPAVLEATTRAAAALALEATSARRIVHGGRSMGGRIASQCVAAGEPGRRPGLPRLPAASARAVREAARGPPAGDRSADAVRPGHARRVRAGGPAARADGPARAERRSFAASRKPTTRSASSSAPDAPPRTSSRRSGTPSSPGSTDTDSRRRHARHPDSRRRPRRALAGGPGNTLRPSHPHPESGRRPRPRRGDHEPRPDRRLPLGARRVGPGPCARRRVRAQRGGPAAARARDRQPRARGAARGGEEGPAHPGRSTRARSPARRTDW